MLIGHLLFFWGVVVVAANALCPTLQGFNSKYVYGAPMFGALPQNTGGGQKDFAWAA